MIKTDYTSSDAVQPAVETYEDVEANRVADQVLEYLKVGGSLEEIDAALFGGKDESFSWRDPGPAVDGLVEYLAQYKATPRRMQ